jgi:GNAT superfamily N-acetyltransferase
VNVKDVSVAVRDEPRRRSQTEDDHAPVVDPGYSEGPQLEVRPTLGERSPCAARRNLRNVTSTPHRSRAWTRLRACRSPPPNTEGNSGPTVAVLSGASLSRALVETLDLGYRQTVAGESSLRLEKMAQEQIGAAKAFLAEHFEPDGPQNRPGWFEWQLANPNGQYIQLVLDGDRIVALSVFMPVKLGHDGGLCSGAFSTNTMVDPAYQRRGIGRQIHLARLSHYDFALSSGQSESNYRLYMKMGFHVLGGYFRGLLVRRFPRPRLDLRYLREVYSWLVWRAAALRGSADFHLELTDAVPGGMPTAFFVERFAPGAIGPVASEAYLEWRYAKHPYFRYQFAKVHRAGEWLGVAVVRRSGDAVSLLDVYCRHGDMPSLLVGLGTELDAREISGVFTGKSLKKCFTDGHWRAFRHRTAYVGNTESSEIRHWMTDHDWCLAYGDSDKER